MQPAFFRRTYDETMDLMIEARNYVAYVQPRERAATGGMAGLKISCETMRVTSRLTQVMAWVMTQRAVHEGEISQDEALAEANRLSGAEVCLDGRSLDDHMLPRGLRSLLQRSLDLYMRVARLERQMLSRRLH